MTVILATTGMIYTLATTGIGALASRTLTNCNFRDHNSWSLEAEQCKQTKSTTTTLSFSLRCGHSRPTRAHAQQHVWCLAVLPEHAHNGPCGA